MKKFIFILIAAFSLFTIGCSSSDCGKDCHCKTNGKCCCNGVCKPKCDCKDCKCVKP